MQGIDQPVAFDNEVREAQGFIQGSGRVVNSFWNCAGNTGKCRHDQRQWKKQIQQLNPETGLIEKNVMFYHGRVIRKAGLLRFKITADGCLRISPGAKQTD